MYFIPGNERMDYDMEREAAEIEWEREDEFARATFGEDYAEVEAETADPDRFVSERDMDRPSPRDEADLAWVMDYEAGALPWQ